MRATPAAIHRMPLRAAAALLPAALLPAGLPAQAQSALHTRTTTFVVSVTVDNDCQLSGATALDFGHIHAPLAGDPAGRLAPAQQYGRFSVSCSRNTRYTLYLDRGNVPGSSVAGRLMTGSSPGNSDHLLYQLYLDPTFSTVWGDGSAGGADGLGGIGTGAAQAYTVYGRILPQDLPAADLYSSVITASLTF
jgi:spore coat protein U-like protein